MVIAGQTLPCHAVLQIDDNDNPEAWIEDSWCRNEGLGLAVITGRAVLLCKVQRFDLGGF